MISFENKNRLSEFVKKMTSTEIQIAKFNYELAQKLNVQAQIEIDRINNRIDKFVENQEAKLENSQTHFTGIKLADIVSFCEAMNNLNKALRNEI